MGSAIATMRSFIIIRALWNFTQPYWARAECKSAQPSSASESWTVVDVILAPVPSDSLSWSDHRITVILEFVVKNPKRLLMPMTDNCQRHSAGANHYNLSCIDERQGRAFIGILLMRTTCALSHLSLSISSPSTSVTLRSWEQTTIPWPLNLHTHTLRWCE